MKTNAKNVQHLLQNNNQDLLFLLSKSNRLQQLNQKVLALIDPISIREYCQVANIQQDKLILLAANGSTATQLKFQTSQLLTHFKKDKDLCMINELQIKLKSYMHEYAAKKTIREVPQLTRKTANIIHEIAQSIDDPTIRKILERIATRVKES